MDSTQPTPSNLPEGYHEDLYWKLSEDMRRVILMNLAALVLLVGGNLLFLRWRRLWYPGPFTFNLHLTDLLMLLGAILLTYVLHELTHGARMRLFGAASAIRHPLERIDVLRDGARTCILNATSI